jgi:drug/metabolite transporter (DMT)-like permease
MLALRGLTQRLSLKDPFQVVRIKTLAAGTFNAALALALGAAVPDAPIVALALGLGVLSYGISVVLDAYALRLHGAAREAAYFATAPFVGAAAAVPIRGEQLGVAELGAMGLMALGVVLLMRERHTHEHIHEPIEHEHLHVHDEHHQHEHAPNEPSAEPHAHPHRHLRLIHDHPHVPDLHHRHKH